jgi:8-oxo-dGTP diphosphatase
MMAQMKKAQKLERGFMVTMFVVAFLHTGDNVLLVRRAVQSFGKGLYSMVGGKVEANETARKAMKREVHEETGLDINESVFELVHVLHRKGTENELVILCFDADISALPQPINNEPEKHDDMRFFNLKKLPENILPAHKQAIECIAQNVGYSEHGW